MSFLEYVHKSTDHEKPARDFLHDAQRDTSLPDVKGWDEIEAYLNRANACSEAITAAKAIWQEYLAARKKE